MTAAASTPPPPPLLLLLLTTTTTITTTTTTTTTTDDDHGHDSGVEVCLFVGCLLSQQHSSVSQGQKVFRIIVLMMMKLIR